MINEKTEDVFLQAENLRLNGNIVKIVMRSKNFKHQRETLLEKGYEIIEM